MTELGLHHVSIVVTDIARSADFYRNLFGLDLLVRPPFSSVGVWLALGSRQLHLIENAAGTFRQSPDINTEDVHFAINTTDFDGFVRHARSLGFSEDAPEGDPKRLLARRNGPAPFPQIYLLDPDRNVVEVNGAA